MKVIRHTSTLLFFLFFAAGCATDYPRLTEPSPTYNKALADTDPEHGFLPLDEEAALQRVMNLFEDFSHENLSTHTRKVYAETLFFRDGFKEIHHIDELETYMVESTKPLRSCTFTFSEPVRSGGDYYLRWTMEVSLHDDPEDHVDRALGISHVRFNPEGKVVFQQDYWDPTDVLYRRIPIANGLIGYVRSKL